MNVSKHWRIMGNYQGSTEEIDHADDEAEAVHLQGQYQFAFGPSWDVWVEVQEYEEGQLMDCYPLE